MSKNSGRGGDRMYVACCTLGLTLTGSHSLKEKRHVVRGVLDSVKAKFNVSAAEIGRLDAWQKSLIGLACVANDAVHANKVVNKAVDLVERNPNLCVDECEIEIL